MSRSDVSPPDGAAPEVAVSESGTTSKSEAAPGSSRSSKPHRARFLAHLPDDPELRRLAEAFERGNYALVRLEAPRLIEQSTDPDVRRAAEDLRARLEPDPLMKYLLVLSIALLILVAAFVFAHDH